MAEPEDNTVDKLSILSLTDPFTHILMSPGVQTRNSKALPRFAWYFFSISAITAFYLYAHRLGY